VYSIAWSFLFFFIIFFKEIRDRAVYFKKKIER